MTNENTKQKAVIFDIDGVLAKISINKDGTPKRGYRDYNKVALDEPIKEIFYLLGNYFVSKDCKIIFITGRKELCKEKTKKWILKHLNKLLQFYKIDNFDDYFKIFTRGNDDHRPADKLKKEIYEEHIKDVYDIKTAFDDDPKVCEMYKMQGIFTLQVMSRT